MNECDVAQTGRRDIHSASITVDIGKCAQETRGTRRLCRTIAILLFFSDAQYRRINRNGDSVQIFVKSAAVMSLNGVEDEHEGCRGIIRR